MNDIALSSGSLVSSSPPASRSRIVKWVGRVMGGVAVAFLSFGAVLNVAQLQPAVEGALKMGFPPGFSFTMGIVQLALVALYVVPRTAPIGVVLWTGYLGGAVATHARLGAPLGETLFPIFFAVLLWLPLYLRDARVRALVGR